MKTKLKTLIGVALLWVTVINIVQAQDDTAPQPDPAVSDPAPQPAGNPQPVDNPPPPITINEIPPGLINDQALSGLARWFRFSEDAALATNWVFAIAPSYAPGLKNDIGEKAELGATMALLYPLGKYAFAGVRADYLAGEFFLPSVSVELKADLKLGGKVDVTPFVVTGVSYAVSGAGSDNGEVGGIYGVGIKSTLYRWERGRVAAFYEIEKWTSFPSVTVHHFGACISWNF